MKILYLVALALVLSAVAAIADSRNVPVGISVNNDSVVINCEGALYTFQAGVGSYQNVTFTCPVAYNSTIINDTVFVNQTINQTVYVDSNNQTINFSCDAQQIADAIANKTGAAPISNENAFLDAIKGAFADRTEAILNTVKDQCGDIKSSIENAAVLNTELTGVREQSKQCEVNYATCNASITIANERYKDIKGSNQTLLFITYGAAGIAVVSLLLWMSGLGSALLEKFGSRREGSKVTKEENK